MSEKYVKLSDVKKSLKQKTYLKDGQKEYLVNDMDLLPTVEIPQWYDLRVKPKDLSCDRRTVIAIISADDD